MKEFKFRPLVEDSEDTHDTSDTKSDGQLRLRSKVSSLTSKLDNTQCVFSGSRQIYFNLGSGHRNVYVTHVPNPPPPTHQTN